MDNELTSEEIKDVDRFIGFVDYCREKYEGGIGELARNEEESQ